MFIGVLLGVVLALPLDESTVVPKLSPVDKPTLSNMPERSSSSFNAMVPARKDPSVHRDPPSLNLEASKTTPLTPDAMEGNGVDVAVVKKETKAAEPTLIEPQKEPAQKAQAPPPADAHLPDIVIAIPTMRRWTKEHAPAPEHYLFNLVTGIWNGMTAEERQHVTFLLMNVDKEPEKHDELLKLQNHPNVRIVTKIKGSHLQIPNSVTGKAKLADGRELSVESFEWVAGETSDAPTLLLEASKLAPYVIFLEDDVTPTSRVMSKVFNTLQEMRREGKNDFLMLDLYTPAIYWGPQAAFNKERYAFECCTQAMLFDSRRVPELVEFEFQHPDEPIDDNIRDFIKLKPDERVVYSMVPNPFEHVGRFSSNPEKSTGITEHRSLNFVP
jgi:hypothetical protein